MRRGTTRTRDMELLQIRRWTNAILKPFGMRLRSKGAGHKLEQEVELLRSDGTYLPGLVRGTASRGDDGQAIRFSGTILDLTERRRHEAAVHRLAFYDALTDLPNRRGLMDHLSRRIAACRDSGDRLAVPTIACAACQKLNATHGPDARAQQLPYVWQPRCQGHAGGALGCWVGGQ